MRLNIEGTLRRELEAAIGVPVYVSVPKKPPEDFATVERTGGGDGSTPISENPTVVIDCYGKTRERAFELADRADSALRSMPGRVGGIARVEPNSVLVHYPDTVSLHERYESTYRITTFRY